MAKWYCFFLYFYCILLFCIQFNVMKPVMAVPFSTSPRCCRRQRGSQHPCRHIQSSLRLIHKHNCSLLGQRRFVAQSRSTTPPQRRIRSSAAQTLHLPRRGNIHHSQVQILPPRDLLSFGDVPGKRSESPSTTQSTGKGQRPLPPQ